MAKLNTCCAKPSASERKNKIMDKPTPSPQPVAPATEPEENVVRTLSKPVVLAVMIAWPLVFRYTSSGTYRLSMVDVTLSFMLAIVPVVIVGLVGLQYLEPEGEDQSARAESARQITRVWAAGLASTLLTLFLRLANSGLQAPSQRHWFGSLALAMAGIWLGATLGMVGRADVRKLNQYLPNIIVTAAIIAGIAGIIAFAIAWKTWSAQALP